MEENWNDLLENEVEDQNDNNTNDFLENGFEDDLNIYDEMAEPSVDLENDFMMEEDLHLEDLEENGFNDDLDVYDEMTEPTVDLENDSLMEEDQHYDDFEEEDIELLDDTSDANSSFEVLEDGTEFYGVGNNDYSFISTQLIDSQGESYSDFQGTCGLCSVANSLRVLGMEEIGEKDVIDYAVDANLCDSESLDDNNGGTTNEDICNLFEHYGCDAEEKPSLSIEDIEQAISSGDALMMSVKAEYLTGEIPDEVNPYTAQTDHWVTVVGLEKNELGEISNVVVQDTGGWGDSSLIRMSAERFNWMRENFDDFTGVEARRKN